MKDNPAESEPKPRYELKIEWSWGSQTRFQEVERYTFQSRDHEIMKEAVRQTAARIAERYCFDCGRLEYPMRPTIDRVVITPFMDSEYFYEGDWTPNNIFAEYANSARQKGAR